MDGGDPEPGDPREPNGPFGVVDFIQLACMSQRTVKIGVVRGAREGVVLIQHGKLWLARWGEASGMEALRDMTRVADARVVCRTFDGDAGAPNLPELPHEHILLDLAREQDERAHDDEPLLEVFLGDGTDQELPEPPSLRLVRPLDPSSKSVGEWLDEGMVAVLAKDFRRALLVYGAVLELEPSNRVARANVDKLEGLVDADA